MANRNYGGQDYDDRNRNWGGRDREDEGRGRDWGAGERGWGRIDSDSPGGGREGREAGGRGGENWGGERSGAYGRDVDWRSDWQQQQQGRGGGYIGTGGGYAGGTGNIGSGDQTTSYGTYSGRQGQGGYGQSGSQWGQGGGYGQSGSSPYGQGGYGQGGYGQSGSQWGQGGYGNYNRGEDWNQGPHSGRGPQGYQRSNERIHEEVCETLTRHGQVDASGINIRVENGEVTLEGTVNSRREKRLAEEAIENLSGVKDVHNQLRVSSQPGNGGSHQETSAAYQTGLQSAGTSGTTGTTGTTGTGATGVTSGSDTEAGGSESNRGRKRT
jgi:hypothetical protein